MPMPIKGLEFLPTHIHELDLSPYMGCCYNNKIIKQKNKNNKNNYDRQTNHI
jgi:hypothetical protein